MVKNQVFRESEYSRKLQRHLVVAPKVEILELAQSFRQSRKKYGTPKLGIIMARSYNT